jgi:hypothetical protein
MALRSPFYEKETPCPACRATSTQRFFKIRWVLPKERESDQHVVRYRWLDDKVEPVHPPYYFVAYCPHCFFADQFEDYNKPQEVDNGRYILDMYRRSGGRSNPVVSFLGERVRYQEIDFESALNLHLLAAYTQLQVPPDSRAHYKLGRILLRVAWLYRERQDPDSREQPRLVPQEDNYLGKLRKQLADALEEFDRTLKRAREAYRTSGSPLRGYAESLENTGHSATVLIQAFDGLAGVFDAQFAALCRIKAEAVAQAPQGQAPRDVYLPSGGESYFEFGSHAEFLAHLKTLWLAAPGDEIEAMQMAIPHFQQASLRDPRFNGADAFFQIASLIIDLQVRCDDLDSAFAMVRGMFQDGMNARQHYMQLLQDKTLDEDERQRINNALRRVSSNLENAADLRRRLLDEVTRRNMPTITRVLEENAEADGAAIEKALEENGVPPGLIAYLKQDGNMLSHLFARKRRFL